MVKRYKLYYSAGEHMRGFRVLWTSKILKQWSFAVLLLSIPLPVQGQPINDLSNRIRRSVGHAQLMHDRGRYLQDRKRQLWLQELFEQVHTSNAWDTPSNRDTNHQPITWGDHVPKAVTSPKSFLFDFQLENMSAVDNLPQETNKEPPLPAATKRKKRVCLGKWRDGGKRRGWPCSAQAQMAGRGQ